MPLQLLAQVSWPVILAVCLGTSAAVLANMISLIMIGKINILLPEQERISYLWWGTEVRKRFKQLYPKNKLVFLLDGCLATLILCFIALVRFWVFG
jgi:hypothetical protein